ncbi:MAG: efflux RND transporter periplasmic adaptor subunit [Solirubrobacteraceae bacterium]
MKLREDQRAPTTLDVRDDGRGSPPAAVRREPSSEGRPTLASRFSEQPVLNSLLVLGCIALVIVAYTAVGPASPSSGQSTRTTTVKYGVVQSTVSGSGNIQSANQLNLGFKTSGTVTHIYVKQGEHVTQGQLLAALDPGSAEVTLEQSKATLQSAEANLAKLEEDEGETSSGQGSSGTGATAAAASTSDVAYTTDAVAYSSASTPTQPSSTTPTTGTGTPTSTSPTTTTTTTTPSTTPTKTTEQSSSSGAHPKSGGSTNATKATESTSATTPTSAGSQSSSSSSSKQSAATREANLASARAAVKSDKLTVQSDEQAVQDTKLYAPASGTIVTVSGEVGETVSGTGTTKASSSSSGSSNSSSSTGSGASGKSPTGGSSGAGSSNSSQGSSSSSSAFAILSDLQSLQLVVALSESEIGSVHEGQIATVTIEALSGRKLAAHVVSVSQVPTSSSGVVTYDVTFQLDQDAEGLKVGMSATAEVVVKQAEGLNVPTSAIKAGTVTVVRNGKHVTQPVTTGLAGNSSTIILSGLKAGEEVVLATTTTGSSSSLGARGSSRTGSRGGSLGGGLGGGGFPAGGFPGGPPGG